MQILGVDVGGSGIKAALVETSTGELLTERVRLETPQPATPKAVGETLRTLVKHFGWTGPVGVGFPAAIQRGVARTAANIDGAFVGLDVAASFARYIGCPTFVANDADVAGLAEVRFGAGKDQPGVVLVITIGTGLGTALFIDGRLLPNTELGHIFLESGEEAEAYTSGAVRDTLALKWSAWGKRFNRYLTQMELLFWPDLIVLGGGASSKLEKFADQLTVAAPVVAASFLNQAGIVGAALYAETQLGART